MADEKTTTSGMLSGKTCLVMGVANEWSIAWKIAKALAAAGAQVPVTVLDERAKRSAERLVADQPGMKVYQCNAESDEELDALGEALKADYGQINSLVHSIAFAPAAELTNPFLETTRDGFRIAHSVSVYSLIAAAQRIVPLMPEKSSIMTMTYLGADRYFPQYNVMGVAKAALEATVRYLAGDLGDRKIRVNAISAGPVTTASARGIPGFSDMKQVAVERMPLGELFTPEELGNIAVFLASDLSISITGETIFVDAGYHIMGM